MARGRGLAFIALACSAAACASAPPVAPQALRGPYRGTLADGRTVVLDFSEGERAFRGEGTIGDQPVMLAGAVGWRGVATLLDAEGNASLVTLELSPDGSRVSIDRAGTRWELERAGAAAAPTLPLGPFSGAYRARVSGATLGEASLVQRGALITGVARIAGDAAGISARASSAAQAQGVATFLDGTQVSIDVQLAADHGSVVLSGFGEPITLERRSP